MTFSSDACYVWCVNVRLYRVKIGVFEDTIIFCVRKASNFTEKVRPKFFNLLLSFNIFLFFTRYS